MVDTNNRNDWSGLDNGAPQGATASWLTAAVAALAAIELKGAAFPHDNNIFHIPIALGYAGSAEGPHDAFHQSLQHFVSFFWVAMANIATEANIRPLFLTLHAVTVLLTVAGGFLIATGAGVSRRIAALASGLLAFAFVSREGMEFGGGELLTSYLTHSQLATALVLFSIALAVRQKWYWAALLSGLAADINLFLGFWLIINLLLAKAVLAKHDTGRLPWKDGLAMGAMCLAVALPTIIWALSNAHGEDTFSYTEFLYVYYPYHSYFHLQLGFFLTSLALSVSVGIAMLRELPARQPLSVITWTAMVTLVGAIVLPYLSDQRLVHDLHPLRYAATLHWLSALVIVSLWSRAENRNARGVAFGAVAILGFILSAPGLTVLALLFLLDWSKLSPTLRYVLMACLWACLMSIAIPVIETAPGTQTATGPLAIAIRTLGPLPIQMYVCAGTALLIATHPSRNERWLFTLLTWMIASIPLVADRGVVIAIACAVIPAAVLLRNGGRQSLSIAFTLVPAALMAGYLAWTGQAKVGLGALTLAVATLAAIDLLSAGRKQDRLIHWNARVSFGLCLVLSVSALGAAKLARDLAAGSTSSHSDHYLAAELWARQNTAPDSLFYEPEDDGFSLFARRPVWWSFKAGAAVMWEPSYYPRWHERQLKAVAATTLPQLTALAQQEQIQYLVLAKRKYPDIDAHQLNSRYCNPEICIVEVARPKRDVSVAGYAATYEPEQAPAD